MTIEVERRGLLSDKQFAQLPKLILSLGGIDLGENNTESIFFLLNNAQVKVQHAISKQTAKIAWKSGGVDGSAHREEVEIGISAKDFTNAGLLMQKVLLGAQRFSTVQKRHDFVLHDVHIAVKHSDDWGYHVELEQLVNGEPEVDVALRNIDTVADKLGLILLTPDEEKRFVEEKIAARNEAAN